MNFNPLKGVHKCNEMSEESAICYHTATGVFVNCIPQQCLHFEGFLTMLSIAVYKC